MRRLLTYIRPYKLEVLIALVLLLVNAALQVVGTLLTKLAGDRYLAPTGQQSKTPLDPYLAGNPWTCGAQLFLVYLLSILGCMLCGFGEHYLMQWPGQRAMVDLRRP